MMSVIKAPVAAAVLAQVDAGRIGLDQTLTIDRKDLVPGAAVPSIGAGFKGEQMRFTVRRLLSAAVSESDNTAVDALIKLVGGPKVVTQFLRNHGIESMRVDLSEGDVGHIFRDSTNGRSVLKGESEIAALSRQRRGYRAYLEDPRNRTTPDAAADFLEKLSAGQLLSQESTKRLIDLMYGQTLPSRLRAGLPKGARFADKCGTSYTLDGQTAAFNDIGIITTPDGRTIIVAAFLTASHADKAAREELFAEIGKDLADPSLLP
jgi:beta-lactamase class A